MAHITEGKSNTIHLRLREGTTLQSRDEVVFASGGIYRLLPFEPGERNVGFERVDGSTYDRIELSLVALERQFGDRIRVSAPSRSGLMG